MVDNSHSWPPRRTQGLPRLRPPRGRASTSWPGAAIAPTHISGHDHYRLTRPARATPWARITELCTHETVEALAQARGLAHLPHGLLRRLVRGRVRNFAATLAEFDARITRFGLAAASAWGLQQWAGSLSRTGDFRCPGQALLLVSNHPGLVDATTLLAQLGGHDVRLLVADRALFEVLPGLAPHLIRIAPTQDSRTMALRDAARHLRRGGTVVTFPAGRIEPDPASRPADARVSLGHWSPSAAGLARLVPKLAVQPALVRDVLATRYRNHILARRSIDAQGRDAVAAALQMLAARPDLVRPRLSIGSAIEAASAEGLQAEILGTMDRLMR
ncbi:hypothetical protein V5738_17680 [Salinisphaera sp. SPP-AMP-43]|uniref:hypothetical protein n=1 Tax=Salinisphaera sp. SPP-AMP-43 TaxID=3121288 RepID=UPI003C6EA24B